MLPNNMALNNTARNNTARNSMARNSMALNSLPLSNLLPRQRRRPAKFKSSGASLIGVTASSLSTVSRMPVRCPLGANYSGSVFDDIQIAK